MNLNTLLDLAIMIFAGMFCGRMAKHVHLPNVTGYLVAGLLIGPSVFGLLSEGFPYDDQYHFRCGAGLHCFLHR